MILIHDIRLPLSAPDEEKEPVLALSVRYSMPEWIVDEWLNAYGMEQTKAILDAFSKEEVGQ